MSDSDSSQSRDYQNFRQITRDRLLHEMLRTTKVGESKATWKVLIMDKFTVRIMSYSCKMADITEEGVSLVEDLSKRRQPMPSMDAVYFIQPLKDNVKLLLSDMSGASPLYKKAYIFFSSPAHKELVSDIKSKIKIRVGALKEINLEYFAIDSQGFITGHERALEKLFGEREVNSESYLQTMGTRIATVFASLREFPVVRYSAARSRDASTEAKHRDLLPTKVAAGVWNFISEYKSKIVDFPKSETCELLILDRSVDQVAPIIHEWTYDAMCHDLLDMEGNKYVYEAPNKMGKTEKKEVLLEDHDPLWLELRHAHIADASERLHEKMTNFVSKNKAAQIQQGSRDGSEISTRDLHKMVQALPQYSDQIEKLSLHVEIAGKINKKIRDIGLRDIGQLEQDLVFGDAGTKDVINFLRTNEDVTPENKLRLLMIYAAIYPQKFDGEKGSKLLQLAKLSEDDMKVVHIMKNLEGSELKKTKGGVFSLKFDVLQKKHACRKRRINEEPWQLSQFYPMIEDLIEKLHKGELSEEEYPCINDSSPSFHGASQSLSVRSSPVQGISVRTTRTTATWARPRASDDGYSSDSVLRYGSVNLRKRGQRIFIFIIGGATRSELRVAHKLTAKLGREVILGSSSLDDPPQFITKLKMLTASEFSLEDLEI